MTKLYNLLYNNFVVKEEQKMLALKTILICSIFFMIIAYFLYISGYKKEAILIKNGIFGNLLFYGFLIIVIGLAP